MSLDNLKRIVDDIKSDGSIEEVFLHFFGEPYLYPDIHDAILYVNDAGLKSCIATNGSRFDEETNKKIINALPSYLTISIQDRIFKECYDRTEGAKPGYSEYLEGIRSFLVEYDRVNSQDTILNLEFGVNQSNTLKRRLLGLNLGDTSVKIEPWELVDPIYKFCLFLQEAIPSIRVDRTTVEDSLRNYSGFSGYFEQSIVLSDKISIVFKTIKPNKDYQNNHPVSNGKCNSRYLTVNIEGDVQLCCIDYLGVTKIGNFLETEASLAEICQGREEIIQGLPKGDLLLEGCRKCLGEPTRRGAFFRYLKNSNIGRVAHK